MAASDNKPLTDTDIRKLAKKKLTNNADAAVVSAIYILSLMAFVFFMETMIYRLAQLINIKNYAPLSLSYYRSSLPATFLLIIRLVVYHVLFVSVTYIVRRHFINITDDNTAVEKFMSKHMRSMFVPSVQCGLCLTMFKMLVSLPLLVGIHGIIYFYREGRVGDINMAELVCLMLSIGFTLVWGCMLIHYFVSLSLVKYIIELNPRADFFEACDLSIKLMDGWHTRVVSFYISLMPYILSCLLLYPIVVAVPFITECRLLLAKEIMGNYWQDKIPAMAKRWEKQMNKLKG